MTTIPDAEHIADITLPLISPQVFVVAAVSFAPSIPTMEGIA
jgi:hypothetical protein